MKSRNKWVAFAGLFFLLLTLCGWQATVMQQQAPSGPWPNVYDCVGTVRGNFCSYSATQLGVNALLEPGSSTSALSNIIDTRGVKQATLLATCTQGNFTVNITKYAEDGATTFNAGQQIITAIPAGTAAAIYIGSESNATADAGAGSGVVRLPQRAVAFSFTNASATPGTCTARLFLSY